MIERAWRAFAQEVLACSKLSWPRTTRIVPGRLAVYVPAGDLAMSLGTLGTAGAASAGLA